MKKCYLRGNVCKNQAGVLVRFMDFFSFFAVVGTNEEVRILKY